MNIVGVKEVGETRDKFIVKAFCLIFISMAVSGLAAQAQTSSSFVYNCHFTDEINATTSLRMKEYFDNVANADMGKVDLIVSGEIKESVKTQLLEVPIWESDTYIKIWYAPQVRVDAVLSWSTSSREFAATYLKNSVRKPIQCTRVSD